jgi:ADP-heptose:LPS heptosyltransferase
LDQKILNGCGIYSLHQSASLVEQSSLVITHDTGLMHIAAAFKKKIVSIWGNTIPEFGMYPYLPPHLKEYNKIIQIEELSCRPCSKIGFDKCPKGHFKCMKLIDEDYVVEQVYDLLKLD